MFSDQRVCLFLTFDWRKIKEQIAERKTYWIYKLIFESIVIMKPVSINNNTICLRPSEIVWKVLEKERIFSKVADFLTWALPFFILTFSMNFPVISLTVQKQPSRGVLKKRCSENMPQIGKRTPMPKLLCNFIEIALQHKCSPVNLLHIIRTPFHKNTSGRLLLTVGPRPNKFWTLYF